MRYACSYVLQLPQNLLYVQVVHTMVRSPPRCFHLNFPFFFSSTLRFGRCMGLLGSTSNCSVRSCFSCNAQEPECSFPALSSRFAKGSVRSTIRITLSCLVPYSEGFRRTANPPALALTIWEQRTIVTTHRQANPAQSSPSQPANQAKRLLHTSSSSFHPSCSGKPHPITAKKTYPISVESLLLFPPPPTNLPA